MLRLEGVTAGYIPGRPAISDIDVSVDSGALVAVLGANGAGKTTTLRATVGALPLTGGTLSLDGKPITGMSPRWLLREGVALVPEGRGILVGLSVRENLRMGGYIVKGGTEVDRRIDDALAMFPHLEKRIDAKAGVLSGGEQQMLAVARALMSRPRYLLLDEPSMGLAPNIVMSMFDVIRGLTSEGMGVLLVEQNANAALRVADRGHALEGGRIVISGTAAELSQDRGVRNAYLGIAAET